MSITNIELGEMYISALRQIAGMYSMKALQLRNGNPEQGVEPNLEKAFFFEKIGQTYLNALRIYEELTMEEQKLDFAGFTDDKSRYLDLEKLEKLERAMTHLDYVNKKTEEILKKKG